MEKADQGVGKESDDNVCVSDHLLFWHVEYILVKGQCWIKIFEHFWHWLTQVILQKGP